MNILKINGQALEGIYVDAAISFNKPAKRVSTYSVPGRNGDLVIDEGTFDNVLITYPVFEKNTFPTEFDAIVNYLASLEGYQRIECSNDPQHYRLGRFVVPQNPIAKRLNRDGYWQLTFDCKPQRWLLSGEEDTEIDANPIDEYSGDIVSIDAVALDEITELKAAIEPVQSLNGQTSPYPAGGGKNILNAVPDSASKNNITFSNADGIITTSGTASGTNTMLIGTINLSANQPYTLSGCASGGGQGKYGLAFYNSNDELIGTDFGSGFTYTPSANETVTVRIRYWYNQACNGTWKPQVEQGSTATAWSPYSNICPISGHTEVNVYRTGKNLLTFLNSRTSNGITFTYDETTGAMSVSGTATANAYSDGSASVSTASKYVYLPKGTYYVSLNGTLNANNFPRYYIQQVTKDGAATLVLAGYNDASFELTDDAYVYFRIQVGNGETVNTTITPQIAKAQSDFEAPQSTIYPISLGQTVYGGTLNVTTGELTVTQGTITMDGVGSSNAGLSFYQKASTTFVDQYYTRLPYTTAEGGHEYTEFLCNVAPSTPYPSEADPSVPIGFCLYDGSTRWQPRLYWQLDAGIDTLEKANQWLADMYAAGTPVVYTYFLATPITVQLTAAEVATLLGQNNIWADTGDVEVKVTSPTVFNNPSLFNSKPLIRVYGIGTFRVNDITVTIASHDKPYIDIDCELQECYYGSENMNAYVSFSGNDFPELEPGNNYMLLASGITKLIVTPRWWIL